MSKRTFVLAFVLVALMVAVMSPLAGIDRAVRNVLSVDYDNPRPNETPASLGECDTSLSICQPNQPEVIVTEPPQMCAADNVFECPEPNQ